jgi:hypothetical protein
MFGSKLEGRPCRLCLHVLPPLQLHAERRYVSTSYQETILNLLHGLECIDGARLTHGCVHTQQTSLLVATNRLHSCGDPESNLHSCGDTRVYGCPARRHSSGPPVGPQRSSNSSPSGLQASARLLQSQVPPNKVITTSMLDFKPLGSIICCESTQKASRVPGYFDHSQ